MASSIFSFEKRTGLALAVLIVCVCVMACLNIVIHRSRASGPQGDLAGEQFQQKKVRPDRKYDMVLLGDSRCLTGVDPAVMEKDLGISVYNDSFSGGGLNHVIYTHAEKNVLKESPENVRSVVLCITPLTLSDSGRENRSYHSIIANMKKKPDPIGEFSKILFKKIRSRDIKSLFRKKKADYIYHDNGYLEKFSRLKVKAQLNGMRQYQVLFQSLTFPQISLDELAAQTRAWRKKNIAVFAFYPPSRPAMEELETRKSSWDLKKTVKTFQDAGGIWLEISDRDQYNAYDSIHLSSEQAKKLSADLSAKLRVHLEKMKKLSPGKKTVQNAKP